jgi:hypothetical protein
MAYTTTGNVTIPMGTTIGSGSGYTITTGAGISGGGGSGSTLISNGAGTGYQWATTASPYITTTTSTGTPSLQVTGDADFQGDLKIKGHSIVKLLEKMEDRLAILMEPDPEKLKKFQALKKAYDNYKLMEKLCIEEKKEDE